MRSTGKSVLLAVAVATTLFLAAGLPAAADIPQSTPTDLGVMTATGMSDAYAINAAGQIVGQAYGPDNEYYLPVIWQNGAMIQLPLPDGSGEGGAVSINAAGQIAGYCQAAQGYSPCIWTPGSTGWTVSVLGIPDGWDYGTAMSINDAGQVLAWFTRWDIPTWSSVDVGCVWDGTAWTLLMDGTTPLRPICMNQQGQVLAVAAVAPGPYSYRLVIWQSGTITDVAGGPGWAVDTPSMNNKGEVIGVQISSTDNSRAPFLYLPQAAYGLAAGLHSPPPVGVDLFSVINDAGQVATLVPRLEPGQYGMMHVGNDVTLTQIGGSQVFTQYVATSDVRDLAVNANGEVCGMALDYSGFYAFYASASGLVRLDGLAGGSVNYSYGPRLAINDSGMVIGQSNAHAVLWRSWMVVGDATASRKGSTITVTVPITNVSSTDTAFSATVTSATLDAKTRTTVLPPAVPSIAPGATCEVTITFAAGRAKGPKVLVVAGTSSVGGFSRTQTITVP